MLGATANVIVSEDIRPVQNIVEQVYFGIGPTPNLEYVFQQCTRSAAAWWIASSPRVESTPSTLNRSIAAFEQLGEVLIFAYMTQTNFDQHLPDAVLHFTEVRIVLSLRLSSMRRTDFGDRRKAGNAQVGNSEGLHAQHAHRDDPSAHFAIGVIINSYAKLRHTSSSI